MCVAVISRVFSGPTTGERVDIQIERAAAVGAGITSGAEHGEYSCITIIYLFVVGIAI